MTEIYVEPIGSAILVTNPEELPKPNKFIAAFDGYRFFKTETGMYAVEE
jgi:hypothetical protein